MMQAEKALHAAEHHFPGPKRTLKLSELYQVRQVDIMSTIYTLKQPLFWV